MNNISILIPRSVLYPTIGFDIVDGIRAGLKHTGVEDVKFDIHNIGLATKDGDVFARCEQVLLNGADIVVAYINPSTAEYVHSLFANSGKLLLVLDSGMHLAPVKPLSHAFFISLEGSLCCRVAARLAVEAGKERCAFTCSFFDAGYRGALAFSSSVIHSGGGIHFNHVTALKRSEFDLTPVKEHLSENPSNGLLAAFCGDMAEDFYKHGADLGLFADYTVFASPYMAEEVWLDKIAYPGGNVVTAVTWGRELDNAVNREFIGMMDKPGKANIFSVLGWEAGYLLGQVPAGADVSEVLTTWSGIAFDSPRGPVAMNADTGYLETPVYRAEVTRADNGNCRLQVYVPVEFLDEERKLLWKDIESFGSQINNSWHNAYPCLDS